MKFLKILNKKESDKILSELKERFGIEKIPGRLIKRGKERIFLFAGDVTDIRLNDLEEITFIERMGIYFAKEVNDEIRLSVEGVQILKNQIKKNIFELDDEQTEMWMKGQELLIKTGEKGFLVMKHNNDYLGCGKASEEKIGNFIPKNRRLRERMQ